VLNLQGGSTFLGENPVPFHISAPQITHGLSWDPTWDLLVGQALTIDLSL
jgi:hypothetical protein